ncbi:hypothetical protein RB213_012694 [Colletotrichum asianum]
MCSDDGMPLFNLQTSLQLAPVDVASCRCPSRSKPLCIQCHTRSALHPLELRRANGIPVDEHAAFPRNTQWMTVCPAARRKTQGSPWTLVYWYRACGLATPSGLPRSAEPSPNR